MTERETRRVIEQARKKASNPQAWDERMIDLIFSLDLSEEEIERILGRFEAHKSEKGLESEKPQTTNARITPQVASKKQRREEGLKQLDQVQKILYERGQELKNQAYQQQVPIGALRRKRRT
jgi:replicative DNA helicase